VDPTIPPGQRLREIAKKLNVSRIEAGAIRAAGYLKTEPDESYAIFYANEMVERRRFTVAHELAHIILNRFHKHLAVAHTKGIVAARRFRPARPGAIEKAVDRIAAELLMPEQLVIPLLKEQCNVQREQSPESVIDRRKVLHTVGKALGVSEWALVLRLFELTDLLAVRLEFGWIDQGLFDNESRMRVSQSTHTRFQIDSYCFPTQAALERPDGWELPVRVKTVWGPRTVHCQAWRRPVGRGQLGGQRTWVVGWTWNASQIPKWDDSII
jgi:Zn-dependent peptidase ImmA (M78 family)